LIDFEQALTALAEARVRFVIVGGLAVTIHGSSYVTFDLDFCHARDRENLSRLAQALGPYRPRLRGVPASLPFRLDKDTLRGGLNFTLTTDVGDIDLMVMIAAVGARHCVCVCTR
jgi:hypothetical protein